MVLPTRIFDTSLLSAVDYISCTISLVGILSANQAESILEDCISFHQSRSIFSSVSLCFVCIALVLSVHPVCAANPGRNYFVGGGSGI